MIICPNKNKNINNQNHNKYNNNNHKIFKLIIKFPIDKLEAIQHIKIDNFKTIKIEKIPI